MKKRDLYFRIAAECIPESVRRVHVLRGNRRSKDCRGRAHPSEGLMQVPPPDTLGRMWIWLRQCYHMEYHRHVWVGNPPSCQEAEADLYALETLEKYGIKVPWQVINSAIGRLLYVKTIDVGHPIVDDVMQELELRLNAKPMASRCLKQRKKRVINSNAKTLDGQARLKLTA